MPHPAHDDRGATSAEYALLAAGVAAIVTVAVVALGGTVVGLFTDTCDAVAAGTSSTSC